MFNPAGTYRIQFHKEFTFDDFHNVIEYLYRLGVRTIYASPVFRAVPGSMHGYDCTHPGEINPELGTKEQLVKIARALREKNIGWLQDIVPNHMAFHTDNIWLMDVLEKGEESSYVSFFDIMKDNAADEDRLMVPFLGADIRAVIAAKELTLAFTERGLQLCYFNNCFPVCAASYRTVCNVKAHLPQKIRQWLEDSASHDAATAAAGWKTLLEDAECSAYMDECIAIINADVQLLQQVCEEQHYRLCSWRETATKINYRRFFTINDLICLRMEDKEVMEKHHHLLLQLLNDKVFTGLRIDHIDGLAAPEQYLQRLRIMAGADCYIIVEKILGQHEQLPDTWPVQGSTGYDFMALLNRLFSLKKGVAALARYYQRLTANYRQVDKLLAEKKSQILYAHMSGELDNLYHLFTALDIIDKTRLQLTGEQEIKQAIGALLTWCPVYRYYGDRVPLHNEEKAFIKQVLDAARSNNSAPAAAIDLLDDVLLQFPENGNSALNDRIAVFYRRCMQFSGPLMAKGMEDTLMYTYNRLLAHNEVGDMPAATGIGIQDFHAAMEARQATCPLSLNATATHDTKRGEDVRARINVLTELPAAWAKASDEWIEINKPLVKNDAPDINDQYFIYQTFIGAYPFEESERDNFCVRLKTYIRKALREAKTHSQWTEPNEAYESAATVFVERLFDAQFPFLQRAKDFLETIKDPGIVNSLSQVLLKFTCPGVPDIYQGTELWDLSLVDPDNRRPVDYTLRDKWLKELDIASTDDVYNWKQLWEERSNGKIKLLLTAICCRLRTQHEALYRLGKYIPLRVRGHYSNHILAFARHYENSWSITVVPLYVAAISNSRHVGVMDIDWKDTNVVLPPDAPSLWVSLTGGRTNYAERSFKVTDLFKEIPIALLQPAVQSDTRCAGILVHITSLPSVFGVGDMGPEALKFVDFLKRTHQRIWQVLPLNPVVWESAYSPYSSSSGMAGNPLLISPEVLAADGLLHVSELAAFAGAATGNVDFTAVEQVKYPLLEKAWRRFEADERHPLREAFTAFVSEEDYWLNDFTLYTILKAHFNLPWYEWPEKYRTRNAASLQAFSREHEPAILREKWLQFIFLRQWQALRVYCHDAGIQLFGDLPFYLSYDSADVWANPHLFCLDESGAVSGVAGVPPDYFSETGQLWGMPTYRWEAHKEDNYSWWVQRLHKNLQLFDLLRLDHFRAFSQYWQVPAGETTAQNGEWKNGPGIEFFHVIEKQLGGLPFVAEDLGDNMEKVYRLRDSAGLPGMRVLQFAFSTGLPVSVDIPHNYIRNCIAYTGTHDNNTIQGWYREETKKEEHRRMRQYTGEKINRKNVNKAMLRLLYASVASTVIVPVQDLLELDESCRMNTPGTTAGSNWIWRLQPAQLDVTVEKKLRSWMKLYARY